VSHNVVIDNVKIANLTAFEIAVNELIKEGANIRLNKSRNTFRTWEGQPNKCDMVLELPGEQFDIGLVKQPDGSYSPVFDHMLDANRSGISCKLDRSDSYKDRDRGTIGRLMQRYAVCAVEHEMAIQGNSTSRSTADNGEIEVLVEYA
jgi:hypothetical protein